GRTAEEAADRLRGAGLPAAVCMTNRDLLLDPHLRARGFFEPGTHAPEARALGTRPYPGMAARLSQTPGRVRRAAPLLGQDRREILSELGLTEEEIAQLERDGITGDHPSTERLPGVPQRMVDYDELVASGLVNERDL